MPDTTGIAAGLEQFKLQTQQAAEEMRRLNERIRQVGTETDSNTQKQQRYTKAVDHSSAAMGKLKTAVIGVAGALGGMYMINQMLDTSSQMTNTKARLDLINDGQQTTAELNNMIFQSANRAYGSYLDTADAVAKLAGQTNGLFQTTQDVVLFTELLNKQFIISGVNSQGAASVMLQLTQALSSGVLRGEEFNAIFENAPQLITYIAAQMGQPVEKMRQLASEGQITAEIIRDAMFAAQEQINTQFEQMPIAWEDVKTKLQNTAMQSFQPLWTELEKLMNSSAMTDFTTIFQGLMQNIGAVAGVAAAALGSVMGIITDNWSIAGPILTAGILLLGAYGTLLLLNTARLKMHAAAEAANLTLTRLKIVAIKLAEASISGYATLVSGATLATWHNSIATAAASGGLMGFAAAAWAAVAPLLPFIAAALLVVGAIYLIVYAFNKLTGSSLSATGLIAGALYGLYAVFYNVFAGIWNFGLLVMDKLTSGIEILINGIITGINWVIKALNYIPGVNIGTIGKVDLGYDYDQHKLEYKDVRGYAEKGYDKGEGLANKVGGMFTLSTPDLDTLTASDANQQLLSSISDNTAAIAENTELTTEDINALIELAQLSYRERTNVITVTSNVTFDQKISKDTDVDGVVREIERALDQSLASSGKGVHV